MQPTGGQNQQPKIHGINPAAAVAQPFRPEIVNNIPVKTPVPAARAAKPLDEDDELDKIMADVGHSLSQMGKQNGKPHLSFFKHPPKSPKPAEPPAAVRAKTTVKARALPPKPNLSRSEPLPAADKPAAPKPPKAAAAPVLAITAAILVTGVLIAAAFYAYK